MRPRQGLIVPYFMASVLLAAACLLASAAQPAFADDRIGQTRIGSLSLTCEYDCSPVANLSFSLWYVASVNKSRSYELASEFADCGADLNTLSLSTEWDATAKSIISWLGQPASVKPCATGSSSATGIAAFSRLKLGITWYRAQAPYRAATATPPPFALFRYRILTRRKPSRITT